MQSIQELLKVVKQLRDPNTGCEWDRVQTFDSIKGNTLEESYEVLHAIEKKNYSELQAELGDLLFQILLYSEMAGEQNYFNFDDVCHTLKHKLITRHPHIFGETKQPKGNWELLKQKERDQRQQFSILDDIPQSFPALVRADKIQKRCAAVGFDWQSLLPVIDKVKEELDEVVVEVNRDQPIEQRIEEELGDLLFSVVNLTRHLGMNAELTLNKASNKFEQRFRKIETSFSKQGRKLNDVDLDEMELAWQNIKKDEL